jgi:hypothetical protein
LPGRTRAGARAPHRGRVRQARRDRLGH